MQNASQQWQDQKQKWSLEVDMNATNVSVQSCSSPRDIYISNFICLSDLPSSLFTLSLVPVPPMPASTTCYIQGRYLAPSIGETIPERYTVTDNHDRRQLNVQRTQALL